MSETALTYIILIILTVFVGMAWVYAGINDFSKETQGLLIPVLGAVLVGFFLLFKFIYIDAPANPNPVKGSLVILHNKNDGQFKGLVSQQSKKDTNYINREGLTAINSVVWKSEFNTVISPKTLTTLDFDKSAPVLIDALEYSIVKWTQELHQIKDSWLNDEYKYLFPSGYSEDATPLIDSRMKVKTKVDKNSFPNNKLFAIMPIELTLPSGGYITSNATKQPFKKEFKIVTDHSTVKFVIQMATGGSVGKSSTEISEQIKNELFVDANELYSYNLHLEMHHELNPLRCYSKEGKLHVKWFKVLSEKFRDAFLYESTLLAQSSQSPK